jgi:hypothetical protein
MVLTLVVILLLAALIMTLANAGWGKPPLWVPLLLVIFVLLLKYIPVG